MTPQTATLLADYNRWMNQRLYAAAATLPPAELEHDRGAFFGSIQGTLNHLCVGDTLWLHRFAQQPGATALAAAMAPFARPTSLKQPLAEDFAALHAYRQRLDAVLCTWAPTLQAEQLGCVLHYRNMAGQHCAKPFGALLLHFFNHQTHHRGQVSTLLFQAGVDVGVTDLLARIPEAQPVP